MAEPYYTTAADLRAKVDVTAEQLSDAEAVALIEAAEDLIDDRLGNRAIDEDTGRKVETTDPALEAWQLAKLAGATLEVAANLYRDPGVESRQRMRSVSGDVATGGPYGPAYGERADALLSASKLAVKWAHTGGRRNARSDQVAQRFTDARG